MVKQRTITSFIRGSMKSNTRRKFLYYACSEDVLGRNNIEILIKELGLSDKYINPSKLERPEYDDKSAACDLLRRDITSPDMFIIDWLSSSKCMGIAEGIVVELINQARSASVLWLLISLDTGSTSSAVRKTILFKSNEIGSLIRYGIPNLSSYILDAEKKSSESDGYTCDAMTLSLATLRKSLENYRGILVRETSSNIGIAKTYQMLKILLVTMAMWVLSYGKTICPSPICGSDTFSRANNNSTVRSERTDSGLDPRVKHILQYFRAMNSVRSDTDSISSSLNIDAQYLKYLARTSTEIPPSLVPNLLIPNEGTFTSSCTNSDPCSSSGYYKCDRCTGETDNILTMDSLYQYIAFL